MKLKQRLLKHRPNEADKFFDLVRAEVHRAEKKFPTWPEDNIHSVAIMMEEAGEAIQASVQQEYESGSQGALDGELIQTAAMCFRAWLNNHYTIERKDVE